MALDIRVRKKKIHTPVPGDVFADKDGFRYLAVLDGSGNCMAVCLDTWNTLPLESIVPVRDLDAILILTEE